MRRTITPIVAELKARRAAAGITLAQVAAASGISKTTLSETENGWHQPAIWVVVAYADALGLDVTLAAR
jgi:transcriptional regulator with XRE-family HTH domain